MRKKTTPEFISPEQPPDYHQKLTGLLHDLEVELPDTMRARIGDELLTLNQEYGTPNTPGYHAYHNDEHGFSDLHYTFLLLGIIARHINIPPKTFELAGYAAVTHDRFVLPEDGMSGEERSALYAIRTLEDAYISPDYAEMTETILVTTAAFDKDGVHQPRLLHGSRHPATFALAIADVGAILFEGPDRMIKDVVNLALEQHHHSDESLSALAFADRLNTILTMQPQFVQERIKDLDDAVPYYFDQYGMRIATAISEEINQQIEPHMQDVRLLLQIIENYSSRIYSDLRYTLTTKDLTNDLHSSLIVQQKLKHIVGNFSTM